MRASFLAIAASVMALQMGVAHADPTLVAPQGSIDAEAAVSPLSAQDTYRALFAALRASNWLEAQSRIASLDKDDPVRSVALAELYTAKNSPKVELFDLLDLLNKASWLPDADQRSIGPCSSTSSGPMPASADGSRQRKPPLIQSSLRGFSTKPVTTSPSSLATPNGRSGRTTVTVAAPPCS